MCATCGCAMSEESHEPGSTHHDGHGHSHVHEHEHGHPHEHEHSHEHRTADSPDRRLTIEQNVLAKNDALAERNRALFAARRLAVFNLTSAPGSGKTTLIEALAPRLAGRTRLSVVEGDQETARDAERVRAAGVPAVQINTRTGCHLDANMTRRAVDELSPPEGSLLLIENVGNLVCPALFDLGERAKIVLMSVTEGEDKPLKYQYMFRTAGVMLLSKIDLLPHLDFDVATCLANARRVNPSLRVFQVSAKTGEGLAKLGDWLASEAQGTAA